MTWQLHIYRFFSLDLWGLLPAFLQRGLSRLYANIYNRNFTRYIIPAYCRINYRDPNYLQQFKPASGGKEYLNFQDFFIRVYKEPLKILSNTVWGCEGWLWEYGQVGDLPPVNIKGQKRNLRTIFGEAGSEIPKDYYFSNVFLHNKNYHRIHSPVKGTISRIEHIPGELVLLRPWIYPKHPSLPALRNERVNLDITDQSGKKWFLSIVGGPAVGTIKLAASLGFGSVVLAGQEVGTFLLGSTCCIASPLPATEPELGSMVRVDQEY